MSSFLKIYIKNLYGIINLLTNFISYNTYKWTAYASIITYNYTLNSKLDVYNYEINHY